MDPKIASQVLLLDTRGSLTIKLQSVWTERLHTFLLMGGETKPVLLTSMSNRIVVCLV